jgi:hypothetical protein
MDIAVSIQRSNYAVEQAAGSHPLAAATHRDRSPVQYHFFLTSFFW